MSLDLHGGDGWSPLEIFPPVPYPHGLREVRTPHGIPLSQSIKRASGVQVPCNKRAITVQYPGPFGVKSPPTRFKPS